MSSPPLGQRSRPMRRAALAGAGIVFAVQMPLPEQRALIPRGALLVCIANAFGESGLVPSLAAAGIDCAAMELLPRITRAQAMDVLSSQANLAGYRAVIEAAGAFQRGFPMMMTAAGTVPPAAPVRHGRRRRRAAGDRHRAAARRDRLRHRRPSGRQGGDQVAGRHIRRRRGRGDGRPDRRLCHAK